MTHTDCPNWDHVSAAIDGELPEPTSSRSLDHARRCAYCGPLLAAITRQADGTSHRDRAQAIDVDALSPRERRWLRARWSRWILAVAAVVIVAKAVPAYATGHGHGLDTQAHVHAARHLATW
ncbi:MAG: hypothetical protein ACFCVK_19755 [Acidimicrobiales bacterium]